MENLAFFSEPVFLEQLLGRPIARPAPARKPAREVNLTQQMNLVWIGIVSPTYPNQTS
jgi:hypothetical protein